MLTIRESGNNADRWCGGPYRPSGFPGGASLRGSFPYKKRAALLPPLFGQQGTTDGQSAYLVKISRDGGATWEPLEYMGIAQSLPTAYKNTYDFLVNNDGYGLPATRRLPYADFGIILLQAITGSPTPQTISTASYGANRFGLQVGLFVHIDLGGANEEYVTVLAVDPDNQTFDAVVTTDHAIGESIRPAIWPTPIMNEGDDLAFDILAVPSPDAGSGSDRGDPDVNAGNAKIAEENTSLLTAIQIAFNDA